MGGREELQETGQGEGKARAGNATQVTLKTGEKASCSVAGVEFSEFYTQATACERPLGRWVLAWHPASMAGPGGVRGKRKNFKTEER